MKAMPLLLIANVLSLHSGCGCGAAAESDAAVAIDSAVEIQIAVVSGLKEGDSITDGDWRIAATCVLPVHSTGGPGHVVSNTDGTIIELQWSDVRRTHQGKFIEFDDGQWRIRNRIARRDNVIQSVGGGVSNPPLSFGADPGWLASCDLDTAGAMESERKLVIRGRLLQKTPPPNVLNLAEMTRPAG